MWTEDHQQKEKLPPEEERNRSILGEAEDEEGESEENEVAASLKGSPEASEAPNLAISNKSLLSKAETNFLKMMEKMTQPVAPTAN
ncbi:hypothetical protein O181_133202 [Austropuccinia psidii MF-1]|uniref:Uncharacterized protein n=1 Tax=Austropuccinia psidii MF-1 TaxID=1389203 RepID=A0A9Q3L6D5_9BASI|nr:hypothetical protein [Austropuccinia psidii MF-1]